MSIWLMMIREIAYRKLSFLLGVLGASAAIGLLVGLLTSLELHDVRLRRVVSQKEEETKATMAGLQADVRKAMHILGYNAVILPKHQPLGDWYANDYAAKTMPESWASRLADSKDLADRYLPRLRQKLKWEEKQWTIIVVGVGEERTLDSSVGEGRPMVDPIPRGHCVVGYELHTALGLNREDEISIAGRTFRVVRCERELGTKDDITLWIHLADAQELTGKSGLINEIMLVEHLSVWGNVAEVRRRVAKVLPGVQVVEIASETLARAHARTKVAEEAQASLRREREKRALLHAERRRAVLLLVPLGAIVCVLWSGLLTYLNVRDRAQEIGLLMAIGFRTVAVRILVLSKAVVLGMVGGFCGFLLGTGGAVFAESQGDVTAGLGLSTALEYLCLALVMGVAASVLGSWLPARAAVAMDPADVLQER